MATKTKKQVNSEGLSGVEEAPELDEDAADAAEAQHGPGYWTGWEARRAGKTLETIGGDMPEDCLENARLGWTDLDEEVRAGTAQASPVA